MSGTSFDGADAVLVDWSTGRTVSFASQPYSAHLKGALLSLSAPGDNEIDRAGEVANELARVYASAVRNLLAQANIRRADVKCIACHGQTIRHRPERGFTVQLQNAALLAELTGITVIADFRSRDIAAGGQGAPMAPAFHEALFAHPTIPRAVVNIGGISNISCLLPGLDVSGFDCGPGNVLMDYWVAKHLATPFDDGGRWARSGVCDRQLLGALQQEPYFTLPPPKSTGRELFNAEWLAQRLVRTDLKAEDVQATLLELTCSAISKATDNYCSNCREIIVCGGGAQNDALLERLRSLSGREVMRSDSLGIPANHVEALGFAWLGKRALELIPTSTQRATGSAHEVILGAIYPA